MSILIYNEDCVRGMRERVMDRSISLIVTDPPYEIRGQEWDGSSKRGAFGGANRMYGSEITPISCGIPDGCLDEMVRCMGDDRINIYLFCNKMQIMGYMRYFVDGYGCTFDILTWHKTNPTPLCSNKYLVDTEYVLFFRSPGVPLFGMYETKRKWWVTSTNKVDKERYGHPTCKPVSILDTLVMNSCPLGGTVLDPFMGSGSTGEACLKRGVDFIGFEIDEMYYETCSRRLSSVTPMVDDGTQLSLF